MYNDITDQALTKQNKLRVRWNYVDKIKIRKNKMSWL